MRSSALAGLEFDPKPGPQLAVRVQARPRPAIFFQARPGPGPQTRILAQARAQTVNIWPRPSPQVSGPGPAHTCGPKMGKPAARKPAKFREDKPIIL